MVQACSYQAEGCIIPEGKGLVRSAVAFNLANNLEKIEKNLFKIYTYMQCQSRKNFSYTTILHRWNPCCPVNTAWARCSSAPAT
jgi:hypothetical protein